MVTTSSNAYQTTFFKKSGFVIADGQPERLNVLKLTDDLCLQRYKVENKSHTRGTFPTCGTRKLRTLSLAPQIEIPANLLHFSNIFLLYCLI